MIPEELDKAKELLISKELTCVLCGNGRSYTSTSRGVKPLVQWLAQGVDAKGFCAADKVIGKATAFLYVLFNVRAVYAQVISQSALLVLQQHNIYVIYETLVENIINRTGDGICPFEEAVFQIQEPEEAYLVILAEVNYHAPKGTWLVKPLVD